MMTRYTVLFFIIVVAQCSCNSFNNEVKGVDEVISYYGGNCKYSIGIAKSINGDKDQYLEIELSNSETVEPFIDIPDFPASNIAYLCFNQLGTSKERYDHIKSVLIFKNGIKSTFTYSTAQLKIVAEKMILVERVVDLIKSGNFQDLKPMLNDGAIIKYNKNILVSSIRKAESRLGNIKGFRSIGFQFSTIGGTEILHISGIISRTKTNHQFSIDVYPYLNDDQVLNIQYKL
jgi:hypothetical protein